MRRFLVCTATFILWVVSFAAANEIYSGSPDARPHVGIQHFNILSVGKMLAGTIFQDRSRSLQSFGAVGDGKADDTIAVSNALNSGKPLICNGIFVIDSLVTITNKSIFLRGEGQTGCTFILNSTQSMFYATLSGGNTGNLVDIRDFKISVNAQISNVSGPAKTAAIFITYPAGNFGVDTEIIHIENVTILPSNATNYILNGIYLNDTGAARLRRVTFQGNSTTFQTTSSGYVYDGTHSPAVFTVEDSFAFYVENGIYMPQEASGGWQGVRVRDFDCVWCDFIISASGSLDGSSGHIDLRSVEGTYNKWGIAVNNVSNIFIEDNYMFAAKQPVQSVTAFPTCIQVGQTIAPNPYPSSIIANNECDGYQYSGATTRYGVIINGFNLSSPVNGILGSNTISNMEVGESIIAGTAGLLVYPPKTLNVTTPLQNLSTAGYNSQVSSSSY